MKLGYPSGEGESSGRYLAVGLARNVGPDQSLHYSPRALFCSLSNENEILRRLRCILRTCDHFRKINPVPRPLNH